MSLILRKLKAAYNLGRNQPILNDILYNDDLNSLRPNFSMQEHTFSCDTGMPFCAEKCGVTIMKRRKTVKCDAINLVDEGTVSRSEEASKSLGIIELIWRKTDKEKYIE